MEQDEIISILISVVMAFIIFGFANIIVGDFESVPQLIIFSLILIAVPILSKKFMAHSLDMEVEHSLWHVGRYGIKTAHHFKKELPFGIIVPLFFTIATLGFIKVPTFMTFETSALKHRAAKRFGFYSYTEVTEWHNALVAAAGVISLFILSTISYSFDFEYLAKMSAFYAFVSMIPLSKLDGTQIFFGSRILWTALACLSVILAFFALVI